MLLHFYYDSPRKGKKRKERKRATRLEKNEWLGEATGEKIRRSEKLLPDEKFVKVFVTIKLKTEISFLSALPLRTPPIDHVEILSGSRGSITFVFPAESYPYSKLLDSY